MKFILFFILSIVAARAADVGLAWNANPETDIAYYNFRTGIQPGTVVQSVNVGNVTQYTVSGLEYGTTYYFTVTAVNTAGGESGPSNEVAYTPVAPIQDKIRFNPRAGWEATFMGGEFQGADDLAGPWTTIQAIVAAPSSGWNEITVPVLSGRYLRFIGAQVFCLMECEFYRGTTKLAGVPFGTIQAVGTTSTFDKAFDGSLSTMFKPKDATGYCGLDTQAP